MASHTVYAVASGKGGVGKTATTVNLGASLAAAGYTVAIVDTDLGMANLGGFAGLDDEGATLHEVLAGEIALEEAVYEAFNGVAVVPSGISLDGFANVETEAIADAVNALRDAFDYVILDLGAGLSHDTVLPLALADAVILVSTPRPLSIQDTAKTREVTEHLGGQVAGVVLTRAPHPQELDLDEIRGNLGLPVLAVIPETEAVPSSARVGESLLEHAPDSPATEGYRGLARIVEEESLEYAPVVPEVPEPEPGPKSVDQRAAGQGAADHEAADHEAVEHGVVDQEPTGSPPPADDVGADSTEAESPEEAVSPGEAVEPASHEAGTTDVGPDTADPGTAVPGDAADSSTPAPDEDSPERTAAEIAAAIEEAAAAGTDPTPASGTFDPADGGSEAESSAAAGDVEFTNADAGAAPAADGAPTDESATEAEHADEDEPFRIEADEPHTTEQEQAVDELFSVEGADPDGERGEDDDDDSKGLLGRFLG